MRANDNFTYLKDTETNPYTKDIFDPIKFISINKSGSHYLSLGGEARPRLEYFSNRKWKKEKINYYSQRLSLHANVVLGKNLRFFAELYHGFTSHAKQLPDYDKLNFHQLFIELPFNIDDDKKMSLIFGRQELVFGTSRLVTLREGPNVRQDFDLARAVFDIGGSNVQLFYGKEVRTKTEVFDNTFTLFDSEAPNAKLWGIYARFKLKSLSGSNELYYIGFDSDMVAFSDVAGEERRHTIGFRRFGVIEGSWRYNTEIIYQFGDNGGNDINAFNIETDWSYTFSTDGWAPTPGLRLVYSSGDKNPGDGKLGTFNSLYVSPNFYNLASTVVPINLMSIHPTFVIKPNKKLKIFLEYVFFWRASTNDGVYGPPGRISRVADPTAPKKLGRQVGLNLDYVFDRHLSFNLNTTYFISESFLKATGESENIFHFSPTLCYKF